MKKDIITVLDNDGHKEEFELVFDFNDLVSKKNYIIYKPLESEDYYIASYKKDNSSYILDTNLTEKEIKKIELVYKKLKESHQNDFKDKF